MRWPGLETLYGPTLRQSPVFSEHSTLGAKTEAKADEKKTEVEKPGNLRWEELHKRVIEHVNLQSPLPRGFLLTQNFVTGFLEYPSHCRLLLSYLDVPPDRAVGSTTPHYGTDAL